jgi:dolichol kinase
MTFLQYALLITTSSSPAATTATTTTKTTTTTPVSPLFTIPADFTIPPTLISCLLYILENTTLIFLVCLLTLCLFWLFGFNFLLHRTQIVLFFRTIGIANARIRRALAELRRKSFHLVGLLIPVIYYVGLKYSYLTYAQAIGILFTITCTLWLVELLRFCSPAFGSWYARTFSTFLRKNERDEKSPQLTGVGFFFLGHLLVLYLFEPTIAVASSLYLVCGDCVAAIVGISFGRIKIGKKSLEGSLAMFSCCVGVGIVLFWRIHLAEYLIFSSAIVATLVELLGPHWLNDNLSIPLSSGLALTLACARIGATLPPP